MGRFLQTICLLAVAGAATPLQAQGDNGRLPEFTTLTGKCLSVKFGKEDMTAACTGTLGRSGTVDGRTGFYFLLENNHVLTFSGFDRNNRRGKADGFAIDRVIFDAGGEAEKPKVLVATGRCSFGDPYRGPITVRCAGRLGQGTQFSAAFRSDGKPPG